jgi:nicotinate-nucleotide adenylyltransferase
LRIGILGGVFNPPHIGHLVCAQEALTELGLDRVVLVPVGEAPHREIELDPGAETRLVLCRAAVGGDERFEVSSEEVVRKGPSYTVDTLRALDERGGGRDELVLILGGDQAATLPRWHDPEGVLSGAEVAVTPRDGFAPDDVLARLEGLRGAEWVRFFSMPRIDVSSTLVRRRVADGVPVRYLVPAAVETIMVEQGLYRVEVGAR